MNLLAILLIILFFAGIWMYVKRSSAIHKRNVLLKPILNGNAYSAADLKRSEEGVVLTVIGNEKLRQRLTSMGIMAQEHLQHQYLVTLERIKYEAINCVCG